MIGGERDGAAPAPRPTTAEYFERKYQAQADPWDYRTSPYEAAKYDVTLAALRRGRYRRALEIGCSIGVFTARLAAYCDSLLAIDLAPSALDRARQHCALLPQVRFQQLRIPAGWPPGWFDLIVISEVGYYLMEEELADTRDHCLASLWPGGDLLLAHWTPPIDDALQSGDRVHDLLGASAGLRRLVSRREPTFRLDLLRRAPTAPAARARGGP